MADIKDEVLKTDKTDSFFNGLTHSQINNMFGGLKGFKENDITIYYYEYKDCIRIATYVEKEEYESITISHTVKNEINGIDLYPHSIEAWGCGYGYELSDLAKAHEPKWIEFLAKHNGNKKVNGITYIKSLENSINNQFKKWKKHCQNQIKESKAQILNVKKERKEKMKSAKKINV